jgi:hypothetical protein
MPEVQLPGRSITRQHPGRENARRGGGGTLRDRHMGSFPMEWTVSERTELAIDLGPLRERPK